MFTEMIMQYREVQTSPFVGGDAPNLGILKDNLFYMKINYCKLLLWIIVGSVACWQKVELLL